MNEKMMKRTYDMLVRLINTTILDADEKLTNYNRLKDFFSSDLHKKYNSPL